MDKNFEPVESVDDYYDGPRAGIANFRGQPHAYRSLYLDSSEWNPDEDRFELTPLKKGKPAGPAFIARGEFRVRQPIPDLPPGVLRPLEVHWIMVGTGSHGA